MEIYVDSLLLLNFMVNYLLLLSAAKISGCVFSRPRLVLGAAIGAAYALAVLFPAFLFLSGLGGKLLAETVMVLAAFGAHRRSIKLGIMVLGTSLAFAGGAMLVSSFNSGVFANWGTVYAPLDLRTLVLVTGVTYGILSLVYRRTAKNAARTITRARVSLEGRTLELNCLLDTGSSLVDPMTNRPVTVVDKAVFAQLLPELELRPLDEPAKLVQALRERYPGTSPRLIPYSALGVSSGLLAAVKCRELTIDGKTEKGALIALAPNPVSDNGSFEAIAGIA